MTLGELTRKIRVIERILAPGSESELWGDYLEDVRRTCGVSLPDDADMEAPPALASYWLGAYAGTECADMAIRQLPTTEPERGDVIHAHHDLQRGDWEYILDLGAPLSVAYDAYRARWAAERDKWWQAENE
jgi:hypothetical protein